MTKYDISNLIWDAFRDKRHEGTYFYKFGTIKENRWCFVVSWMNIDGGDNWQLMGKVAYQPINSIMQCDYDVDWLMPYDEKSGEVDDTELLLTTDDIEPSNLDFLPAAEWFIDQWERIRAIEN